MRSHFLPAICVLGSIVLTAGAVRASVYSDTVLADNPIGYWRLGEPDDSSTAFDSSGNGRDGTYSGGVTPGRPGAVAGDPDTAAHFDGIDGQVNIPDVFHPTSYTVEALVNLDTVRSQSIFLRTDGNPNATWSHQLAVNAQGNFVHYAWDGSARAVTSTTVAEPGRWYDVAGTAEGGGAFRLFVNGVEEGTATTIGAPWAAGNQYMIGSTSGNAVPGEGGGVRGRFEGTIDEVALYDVALSDSQLAAHAAAALPEPASLAAAVAALGLLARRPRRRFAD